MKTFSLKKAVIILFVLLTMPLILSVSAHAEEKEPEPYVKSSFNANNSSMMLTLRNSDVKPGDKVVVHIFNDNNSVNGKSIFDASVFSDGSVNCKIRMSKLSGSGKFSAYFYKVLDSDKKQLLYNTSFEYQAFENDNAKVYIGEVFPDEGKFQVIIEGVQSPFGIKSVKLAVWTQENDQDDIEWPQAKKQKDGTYMVTVKSSSHMNSGGKYNIHAYAANNVGDEKIVSTMEYDFPLSNDITSVDNGVDETHRTVTVINPSEKPPRIVVRRSDKTEDKGVSKEAEDQGNNTWTADFSCKDFGFNGEYNVSVYAEDKLVKETKFKWNAESALAAFNSNQEMYDLAQQFDSGSDYLILLDRSLHRVGIYQGSKGKWREIYYWPCVVGMPETPSPTGTYTITWRKPYFGTSEYTCYWATNITGSYYFHSQPYLPDSGPYELDDPTMDAEASHGCVRLYIENAKWIYDNIPNGTLVYIYN